MICVGFENIAMPSSAAATMSERGLSSQRVRHDSRGAIGAGPGDFLVAPEEKREQHDREVEEVRADLHHVDRRDRDEHKRERKDQRRHRMAARAQERVGARETQRHQQRVEDVEAVGAEQPDERRRDTADR